MKVRDLHQADAQSGDRSRPRAFSHPGGPTDTHPGDDAYCSFGGIIGAQLVRPCAILHMVRHPHLETPTRPKRQCLETPCDRRLRDGCRPTCIGRLPLSWQTQPPPDGDLHGDGIIIAPQSLRGESPRWGSDRCRAECVVLDLMFYNWKLSSAKSSQGYSQHLHCSVQGIFTRWSNRVLEIRAGQ